MQTKYTPYQLATGDFPWLPAKGQFSMTGALYMTHVSNEGWYFMEGDLLYVKDVEPADPEEYSPAYCIMGDEGNAEYHLRMHGPVTEESVWEIHEI